MTRPLVHSLVVVASVAGLPASAVTQAAVYQYTYAYNAPELNENHFIVLDSVDGESRGWYYGTSDEFDAAREGYLPGFFVAPMSRLQLSVTGIAFTLTRPARLFTSPVPLEYRDASEVPAGRLEEWSVPLLVDSMDYAGKRTSDAITLDVPGGAARVSTRGEPAMRLADAWGFASLRADPPGAN